EAALDAEYPAEQQHGLALDELFVPHVHFFVARVADEAVGCGGVAISDADAEVKRMYVRPHARGRGVAEALLAQIEATARDAGHARLVLETGDRQLAAIRAYERDGIYSCAPLAAHATMPPSSIEASVAFEKPLLPCASRPA